MTKRRGRSNPSLSMPWTAHEDEKLREIAQIGLASDYWKFALPARTFGEIVERRLDLGIKSAALL